VSGVASEPSAAGPGGGAPRGVEACSRGQRRAHGALRIGAACYGIAAATHAWRAQTPVFSVLFLHWDLSEAAGLGILRAAGVVCAVAALALAVGGRTTKLRVAYRAAAAWIALWAAATCAAAIATSELLPWATLFGHAVRYVGAAVLAACFWNPACHWKWGRTVLALAAAATFVGHGLHALDHRGQYLDFLFSAGGVVGVELQEATAKQLLTAIGCLDLVVAALLLVRPWRWVAGWMVVWAVATASMRVVHGGVNHWPEILVRAPNAMVPLAVLFLTRRGR